MSWRDRSQSNFHSSIGIDVPFHPTLKAVNSLIIIEGNTESEFERGDEERIKKI